MEREKRAVPVALALALGAWLALEPWRPVLEGDEWGYFESIVRTTIERRPIVSDWLNPSTVGFSVPAALLTLAVGSPWLGGALTLGMLGLLGLVGFARLLEGLSLGPGEQARGLLALAFFPVFLAGWTRLGSGVPAFSLMCLSLSLLLPQVDGKGAAVRPLLLAGALAAWAVAIRQNHLVLVAAGALALARGTGERRPLRLLAWCAPTLLVLLAAKAIVPPTFAQQEFGEPRLARLLSSPRYFAVALLGGLCFSSGCATVFAALIAPRRALRFVAATPWAWRALAFAVLAVLVAAGGVWSPPFWANDGLSRILPSAFNPVSQQLRLIPAATSAVGAFCLGSFVWAAWRGLASSSLLALAASSAVYLIGAAGWGYADYYFLEPILLLALLGLRSESASERAVPAPSAARIVSAVLCAGMAGSWYAQRAENDHKSAQLRIGELALRERLADVAALDGVPFGLYAWNLFPPHVERWRKDRIGHPALFWERLPPAAAPRLLRLRCSPPAAGRRIVSAGRYRAGLEDVCWSLVGATDSPDRVEPIVPHRFLPLDSEEWSRSREQPRAP